ncbi:YesL family protein [Gracilibacillus saliphilus]|uniref:YesL family protein n=1 Tax=Gracilibacillus saliphilus TaxID=543890 RepID=UPI0013D8ADDE|nr:DUF624 domain-containing protein [Gracilibacillus saliphilus]
MNKSENIFFRILDIFAHFVLLNALWIICSVPIVTIFPATTALFGVVRKWHSDGTDAGSVRLFFSLFRENFTKSFMIGILWTIAGLILFVDWSILQQVEFTGKTGVFALLVFSIILFIFMTMYVFFVLVHYELSILQTLKNALFLSLGYFIHTLLLLVTIAGVITITLIAPIFLIIFGSILAFTMYYIFHKLSIKVEQQVV